MKQICVLASGGDAPGMNACLEGILVAAGEKRIQVFGAFGGYDGLIEKRIEKLDIKNISHLTGSVLKCGRSEAFKTKEGTDRAVEVLKNFDALIVMGGNGSLSGAGRLSKAGVRVIGIPATIDNDLPYTTHSLGFSSAVEECVRLIDNLRSTMRTNDMDHVVQLMGRGCSLLTQKVGFATFAEIVDINENRHTPEQVAKIFETNRAGGQKSNLMVMQEKVGGSSLDDVVESVNYLIELSQAMDTSRVRMTTLGHLQRGAAVSAHDRWLGCNYGRMAVELLSKGKHGVKLGLTQDKFMHAQFS